jgi:threonine aldolase
MIDFLSDTVTVPTQAMRDAMHRAEVGDDVYGEDRATSELEGVAAELMGKEAACFLASGTMANLTAILAQCARGKEILVGDESDLYNYEAGGVSVLGGIVLHPIRTEANGEISLINLDLSIRDEADPECAQAGIIAIETPNVQRCGVPLSLAYLARLSAFAQEHRLPLHIDGARIFNAAIALGISANRIAAFGDTVQFCLSKSLGCPVGSVVAGTGETIKAVRRWRKLLGGGMRQTGFMAAAGLYALRHHVDRLAEDHVIAHRLALGLATIDELQVNVEHVFTNMVVFKLRNPGERQLMFLKDVQPYGIRFGAVGEGKLRAVTHLHHTASLIDEAIVRLKRYFRERDVGLHQPREAVHG